MVVRRDSLRAQTDFFSPMTGNTSTSITPKRRYGDEVKSRMADIRNVKSTRVNPIQAAFVDLIKTDDPFTQIDTKKSYAPEEEEGLLEGLGNVGESNIAERVEEFLEPEQTPVISGGSNQGQKRADQQFARQEKNPSSRTSTAALVARDNRRYGNTVPDGSFGINSKSTDDFSKDPRYKSTADPTPETKTDETRTYYGQGGLPLGTTTIRQGGEVKDGKYVGPQTKGPAINASGFQQKNVRGSGIPGKSGKDESARPKTVTIGGQTVAAKQSVASLPSNYKSTEAKAFAAAKAYQQAKKNPNVKAGVDSKGQVSVKAADNSAKSRAQAAAISRKATGTTISQQKAANQASMRAAAAERHANYKAQRAAGTHARTASAQRARNKAAAKARAKAAAKRRKSKKSCPDPSMLILMANGSQKRAGDLMIGDLIKTNHEKDMKLGEYKVEYVNVVSDIPKTKLTFDESVIVCSLTHKFYVDDDWKAAEDMVIGDKVSGQKLISIDNVEDGDVVHITVEDAHTYICEGLLSHNKRCDIRTKEDISKLTDMNLLRDDLANVAYFVKELQETI